MWAREHPIAGGPREQDSVPGKIWRSQQVCTQCKDDEEFDLSLTINWDCVHFFSPLKIVMAEQNLWRWSLDVSPPSFTISPDWQLFWIKYFSSLLKLASQFIVCWVVSSQICVQLHFLCLHACSVVSDSLWPQSSSVHVIFQAKILSMYGKTTTIL